MPAQLDLVEDLADVSGGPAEARETKYIGIALFGVGGIGIGACRLSLVQRPAARGGRDHGSGGEVGRQDGGYRFP